MLPVSHVGNIGRQAWDPNAARTSKFRALGGSAGAVLNDSCKPATKVLFGSACAMWTGSQASPSIP
jgi:NAD+--asparagine ADP-ribosyltransferase